VEQIAHYSLCDSCLNPLEKVIPAQLVKKFPAFYGTRRFITLFTRTHHWTLSLVGWILRSALILSSHLRLNFKVVSFI